MPYTVSEITDEGVPRTTADRGRFSFTIQEAGGLGMTWFTASYANKADAERAREAAQTMIQNAVTISR